jgi:carbon-monoxide dehydrogenase large subunit
VRTVTSRITGVPENRIRVQMGDVGGGFGQKAYLARDEQIVLLGSFHLGRPLKWIEDRHENFVGSTSSRAERCTVTIAADDDGTMLGIAAEHLDEVGVATIEEGSVIIGGRLGLWNDFNQAARHGYLRTMSVEDGQARVNSWLRI